MVKGRFAVMSELRYREYCLADRARQRDHAARLEAGVGQEMVRASMAREKGNLSVRDRREQPELKLLRVPRWCEYSAWLRLWLRGERGPQTTSRRSHKVDSGQCCVARHCRAVHEGGPPSIPAEARGLILPRQLRERNLLLLFLKCRATPPVGASA